MFFGNSDGINILTTLESHARILDEHTKELQVLRPYSNQMALIRRFVLENFSGMQTMHNIRWQKNNLPHGGQVATDIRIIQQEHDIERKEIWCQGFQHLYGIEYEYGHGIIHDHIIINILNIHADALTSDICRNDEVVSKAADLIELWCSWADNRTEMYPFREPAYENMLSDFLQSV